MAEKRNLTTKMTIDNLLGQIKSTFTKKTAFNALDNKVTTLIAADENKSVRTIANEELAAQLIPEEANEALDTLQEIAQWIQDHPGDAAAMNAKLTLGTRNVAGYVKATGTYVEGTTYYEDAEGNTAVDTTGFEVGVTSVANYYVAGQVAQQYSTVNDYVEAVEAGLDARLDTLEAVAPTKVEASETNGNIKIDGVETTVYTLPENVVKTTDIGDYESNKNGFIKIQGSYTTVYVLPEDVLHESDITDYTAAQIAKMLADPTFSLSANSGSTTVGNTTTFTATVPSTTTLVATSANTDVATVEAETTADGDNTIHTFTVTGVAAGNTTIDVVTTENEYAVVSYAVTVTA